MSELSDKTSNKSSQLVHELLRDGYQNCQSVIKFLDSKVLLINAVNTLWLGFAVLLGKWWVEVATGAYAWPCLEKVLFILHPILLILVGYNGSKIILKSAQMWIPNHSPLTQTDFTPLFPEWDGEKLNKDFVDKFLRGIAEREDWSECDSAKEYAIQNRVLGGILHKKISSVQSLESDFKWMRRFLIIESIFVVICITWGMVTG